MTLAKDTARNALGLPVACGSETMASVIVCVQYVGQNLGSDGLHVANVNTCEQNVKGCEREKLTGATFGGCDGFRNKVRVARW